ncbi:MAG: glycosyltransferase [Paracoccaceae bacterium]
MTKQPDLSILLLAYNQESVVQEAIQSAFAQTADNLEIIISDDKSPDKTYEVMQEAVASYSGPHQVRCIQSAENMGLKAHLNHLVTIAASDRIMCIAGDDISFPHRAARLIQVFDTEDPLLIHSDADPIDAAGQPAKDTQFSGASLRRKSTPLEIAASQALYLGASVAFHKDLFRKYGPLPNSPAYEDLILGFRATLEDRVSYVQDPLLQYRVDVGISKAPSRPVSVDQTKALRVKKLERDTAVLEQRILDSQLFGADRVGDVLAELNRALSDKKARLDFHQLGAFRGHHAFGQKLKAAANETIRLVQRKV